MSKSLGNGIEPEEIIKQYGADVLRLWVASVDFNEDVRLSDTILDAAERSLSQVAQHSSANRSGNLDDFDPDTDAVPGDEAAEIDQWILLRAEELVAQMPRLVRRIRVPQGLSRASTISRRWI